MEQKGTLAFTAGRVALVALVVVAIAIVVLGALKYFGPSNFGTPEAPSLPKDLARSGLEVGAIFPADQLKLEELHDESVSPETGEKMVHTGYQGANLVATVDENDRLNILVLLADTDVCKLKPGLPFIDPRVTGSNHSMLELKRSEVEAAYGPPSWVDGCAYLYDFDKGLGAGLIEVMFFFMSEWEIKPTDQLMSISVTLYEGDKASEHYQFVTEHEAKIYQWPL